MVQGRKGMLSEPLFTVPFLRDPKFVGREDIIQDIEANLRAYPRLVLVGLGGAGYSV